MASTSQAMKSCTFVEYEWNEATNAFKIVLNALKGANGSNSTIQANIHKINKYIFKIPIEDDSITTNYNLNDAEFDELLNQVDGGDKKQQQQQQQQQANKEENKKEDESQLKERLMKQFCKEHSGWWNDLYTCRSISPDEINSNPTYAALWDDFYSIHTTLIETKLKEVLIKHSSNNSRDDVDYLYSKLRSGRRTCSYLPFKHEFHHLDCSKDKIKVQDHISMIEHFDEVNNKSLKTYCIIFNSVLNIFLKEQHGHASKSFGIDGVLEYGKQTSDENASLLDLCVDYFLDQIAFSCIFGKDSFISNNGQLNKLSEQEKEIELKKQEEHKKRMKLILFNNDLKNFVKLMEYCLQDIKHSNKWKVNYSVQGWGNNWQLGISFFIINRLSFVIFHDLMCYEQKTTNTTTSSSSGSSNKSTSSPMFPSLEKFFKWMYNFCVYIHCLPTGGTINNELYLVKQYHSLKNTLYTDIYDGNNDQIKLPLLKNFNYFEAKSSLMRAATNYHLSAYVLLLVKDGHSCNVINRRADRVTALQFARQQNLFEILSHFSRFGDADAEGAAAEAEAKKDEMKDDSKEKEQTSSSSSKATTRMNEKSLELRYDGFMNQSMAAKYFLVKLGCKMRNEAEISGIEHKLLEYDHQGTAQYKGHYSDDFYYSLSDLVGLQTNNDGSDLYGSRSPEMAMRTIVSSVISILSLKMVVSQDLLIICAIYCTQFCDKNNEISRQFFDALKTATKDCLQTSKKHDDSNNNNNSNSNYDSKEKEKENGAREEKGAKIIRFRQRNYQWFKYFLLDSAVWLVKDTLSDVILFENALDVVNDELIKQKQYIWQNIQREQSSNPKAFAQLTTFGDKFNKKNSRNNSNNSNDDSLQLRQDRIGNGIKSNASEYDLIVLSLEAGLSGRDANSGETNNSSADFNIQFESNTKIYLTQCLTFAHLNNKKFQSEMKSYFKNLSDNGIKCKYQAAPVKLHSRCLVKCTSDYGLETFPSAACILDFLRFSVTFDSIEVLVKSVNQFISDINNNNIKCLKPNGVLRVKNGFKNITTNWKTYNDAEYLDIKLNLIYRTYGSNNEEECSIVEAQFLLKFLLKAKKMGHKLYAIVRQSDLVHNIANQVYNIDGDYEQYQFKINRLIDRKDTPNLMKQLLWKPHIVLSMINKNPNHNRGMYRPLFYTVCEKFHRNNNFDKFLAFFLNCLFHFSFILLNENENDSRENTPFLGKYVNYNDCNNKIVFDRWFWGINTQFIDKVGSIKYNIIETIMNLTCFNGLSQMDDNEWGSKGILHNCSRFYCYPYLSLIKKYMNKNELGIKRGINFNKPGQLHELTVMMRQQHKFPHLVEEMLKIYLDFCQHCNVKVSQYGVQNAMNTYTNDKCVAMLKEYYNTNYD